MGNTYRSLSNRPPSDRQLMNRPPNNLPTGRLLIATTLTSLLSSSVAAHGDEAGESSWRALLGGFDMMILANSLHSLGSMLLLSGILILYYHVKRHLDEIPETEISFSSGLSLMGKRLTIVGLVFNLTGGLMRLYQPGHPSLLEFFANRWTSVMLIKHMMIIVMVYLCYLTFREDSEDELRIRALRTSVVLVITIGLLGVVASVVGPGA